MKVHVKMEFVTSELSPLAAYTLTCLCICQQQLQALPQPSRRRYGMQMQQDDEASSLLPGQHLRPRTSGDCVAIRNSCCSETLHTPVIIAREAGTDGVSQAAVQQAIFADSMGCWSQYRHGAPVSL